MLRWVRDLAGKSIEQAAKRVSVREEQVADWESEVPTKAPTVRQARELAELYQVSYLEFFRPELPVLPDPKLIPDFRLFRAAADPSETKELKSIQLWAEVQRINALDLYAEVGEAPPPISKSLFTTTKATPEGVAEKAREALNFPIAQQIGRSTEGRRQIPGELRRRIEALGILTLRRTDIGSLRVRGFCIAIFPLPIIVIGSEAPTAQVFTLAQSSRTY
jgi:transcriptional regulator with XRE-family HTH domain